MLTIRTTLLAAALALAGSSLAQTPESPAPPDPAAFSGAWVLNPQASDDIGAAFGKSRGDRPEGPPGGMGGGRGGRQGMGGGGRPGGGRMMDEDRPVDPAGGEEGGNPDTQARLRLQKEASRLDIFTDGTELNITNGLDVSRLLFCDGRETTIWTEFGEIRAGASWEDGTFREWWKPGRGPGRTVTYRLAPDGNRLTVTEERNLPGNQGTVQLTLVYDRVVQSPADQ